MQGSEPLAIALVACATAVAAVAVNRSRSGVEGIVGCPPEIADENAEAHMTKARLLGLGYPASTKVGQCIPPPEDWRPAHHPLVPGTIFVSIASYRDDECKDTVVDLFRQASDQSRIYVGAVQQNLDGATNEDCFDKCVDCAARKASGHIRVLTFSHKDAKGPTLARYHASKLWRGEEFFLQIDSHTKFEKGWDDTIFEQMRLTGDPKAVLGGYPPTDDEMRNIRESGYQTMVVMCGDRIGDDGLPSMKAHYVPVGVRSTPPRVPFMAAGLMCMPGRALYDVPYDPYLAYIFFGEEVLYSARLWTSGYTFYAPLKPFCTHHYGREGKPKFWDDHELARPCRFQAVLRAKFILGLVPRSAVHPDYLIDVERYGLGRARSLDDYWRSAGVDLKRSEMKQYCILD